MKLLFYMGHPAHYHLFKNIIKTLDQRGHETHILIKKKDILEDLLKLSGMNYINILPEGRKSSKLGLLVGMIKRDVRIFNYVKNRSFDVLIGTSVELPHIGSLLKIPSINVNEDDASVVPYYAKLSYPFSSVILSPVSCDNGKWNDKSFKYKGYHELAYLHPDHFVPEKDVVEKYFSVDRPYFIIRLADLTAHHDTGIKGIDSYTVETMIHQLSPFGRVYISSEKPLEPLFEPYRIPIKPIDIHHVLAFADIYIGDSQTMAAEAAVLGTPFIRINGFVGKIGYLNELENKYQLGYGIHPKTIMMVFDLLASLLSTKDLKAKFTERRNQMLGHKIDVTEFMVGFIETFQCKGDRFL